MLINNVLETTAEVASEGTSAGAIGGAIGGIIVYVVYALSYSSIAKKTGYADQAWWAWVPVLNLWLAFKIAGMGFLWFVLTFVPVANVFAWLRLCLGTAKVRNKGAGTGILAAVIPVIGFPMLASGD